VSFQIYYFTHLLQIGQHKLVQTHFFPSKNCYIGI